jgi:hypothetical protein
LVSMYYVVFARGAPANYPRPILNQCVRLPYDSVRLCRRTTKGATKADKRPFFYAVGFHKPHIPWTVPQVWYDKYPLARVALPVHRSPPADVPPVAMNNILSGYWANSFSDFAALRANGTISPTAPADNSTLDEYWSRRARQACVISFHLHVCSWYLLPFLAHQGRRVVRKCFTSLASPPTTLSPSPPQVRRFIWFSRSHKLRSSRSHNFPSVAGTGLPSRTRTLTWER